MRRREDERLVTGRGRFTDDGELPGALWAVFVRAPHAHADIASIDIGPALALPGAHLVLTGDDLAALGVKDLPVAPRLTDAEGRPPRSAPWPVLARERVRHVGQAVALCVADSELAALDMAEAVAIDWRPLPVVADIRDALAAGAPQLSPDAPGNVAFRWGIGDAAAVAAAFARAAHVVEVERVSQRVVVCPMEPRAAIARYDATESTWHLHTGNQGMVILRDQVAHVLGVDKHSVVVTSHDVGGAFGIRNGIYPEYPALLIAARQLRAPVRWRATRGEAFVSDAQARDSRMRGRMALDADGRILALEARADAALGAAVHFTGYFIASANFGRCLAGPYRMPAVHSETTCVLTNTVPTAPYRGAGRPEAAYLTESLIEAAARKLGIDAIELRRRNLLTPESLPHRTAVGTLYDSGDFPRLLDAALKAADWPGAHERKQRAAGVGKLRGIGLGMFVEISGGVPNERAELRVASDGRVVVRTALGATGQGHQTVFAGMAAEMLGIDAEQVTVSEGDSRGFEDGGAASASRGTTMAGLAMRAAAEKLVAAGRARAAARLGVHADALIYARGQFTLPGSNRGVALAALAGEGDEALVVQARIEAEPTFPNGAHVAEVEVDPETGVVRVVSYVAVDDCGRVIAHELAEGQVHGAIAQGIGQVLMEHGVYDRDTGQLLAGSLMDYALPRAADLPSFRSELQPSAARSNPLGVKGLAEGGTVGALPAVTNAILDALAPLGVEAIEMPATPARIWAAIETARARKGDR